MASIVNTLSEYARLKRLQYSGLDTTGTITPSTPEEYIAIGIQPYDDNLYAIANLTGTTGFLKKTAQGTWILDTNTYLTGITSQQITTALGYTPVTNARTLTINGVTYDLTADRSWTIAAGVTSFNTRTGAITLLSNDVTTALGYTPYSASNPNGYITGITSSMVTTALGFTPENVANKGVANGYASLDGSGLVPSTQLPSYVDDVLEYTNLAAFPATGTTGKIYVDLSTNKIYRWSGSTYIEVSPTVGTVWGGITGTLANQTDLQSALNSKQPLDADLTAIASLSGTTGFLVKTAADTWTLDTNVYLTSSALTSYVPYTGATTALNLGNNNFRANRIYGSTAITIDNASSAGLVNFYTYTFGSNTYAGAGYVAIGSSLDNGLSIYYTNASVTRIAHLNGASLTGNRTYTLPDATGTFALTSDLSSYVPTTRTITINGTTYDLSANRSWTINSMVYPGAGIAVSTGTAWGTSITDNSTNWNTAYSWGNHASAGYLTTSSASATYLTISNAASTYLTASGAASTYQPLDGDLTSIAGLAGTSGLLKKTAANTWTLDTTAYGTGSVTSVALSVPTGLTVSGSPITTSGTLAITLTAGYSIPTTASQTNWDSAYTDRLKWDGGSTGLVAATGRTSLGATTVGSNLFTLTNPSAITFLRINADNTVSTLDAATFRTAIGAGTSSTTGTVTSVTMTTPTGLTVSGSPITSSGTLALTFTAGYSIPTTASQTNWDTAYGWGNHASAGYLTSATAATTYVPVTRTLTINGTTYDLSANRSWTISAGSTALSGLSDVTITSVANGQLLQYSTASSKWVNWTPNYLTSYTETDTLATVTGRGASTSTAVTFSGGTSLVTSGSSSGTSAIRIFRSGQSPSSFGAYNGSWRSAIEIWNNTSDRLLFLAAPETDHNYALVRASVGGMQLLVGGTTSTVGTVGLQIESSGVVNAPNGLQQAGSAVWTAATLTNLNQLTNGPGYTTNTGTVTSVSGTGTVSGLTLTGAVTTSGSLTLGGTLSVANSATTATSANTASAIVARDASGNFTATTITATGGGNNGPTYGIVARDISASRSASTGVLYLGSDGNHYLYFDGTNYIMPSGGLTLNGNNVLTAGNYTSYSPSLTGSGASGTWGISITGNAATATSTTYLAALANYVWSASTTPTSFNLGIQSSFVSSSQGFQSYGSVMTMNTYSGGGGALQLYVPYSPTYGGNAVQVRFGNYDVSSGNSWTAWKTLLQSDNWNNYAPGLTGGGASGTWGISITGSAASITGTYGGTLTSSQVTTALGYTPYNSTNPNGYTNNTGTVTSVSGTGSYGGLTLSGTVTTSGSLTLGGTPTGTWPISISGNAATAYGWSNTPDSWYGIGQSTSAGGASAVGGYYPWTLSYHTGLALSAHSSYGGIRFYNQNYPTAPMTATPVMQIVNGGVLINGNTAIHSGNYTSYSPTLTGGSASGTWGINITGTAGSAPNGSNANGAYNVSPGEGNGVYFWSDSTNYTIKMGYTAGTYQYGPVNDYSMRFTMGAGTGRGFTWGYAGNSPTMGLNAYSGNLQIAGTFTEASSIRYKDNVADLTYTLEDVLKLRSVTYTKKGTDHVELGFIAEEVNDIIPEAVMKNEDGSVESISYGRLTAVLLNAVKEQQKQINKLKELLNTK